MSVTIRIPTPLRKMAGDKAEIVASGKTVREALESLRAAHPELASRLFDDKGGLRRYVNFYLNERDIRDLSGAETPVKDGDVLTVMPAIAGG